MSDAEGRTLSANDVQRPGVVVGRDVQGLTAEQMIAAAHFVDLHTLRSSGYCTCGQKVPLFGYRAHLEDKARLSAPARGTSS